MNEILNSLQPMVQKLSETFCVSVDVIQNNLPEFLSKFGAYSLISRCGNEFILVFLIAAVIFIITVVVFDYDDEALKKGLKIAAILLISLLVIDITLEIIQYFVSPEIYGAMQLLEVING